MPEPFRPRVWMHFVPQVDARSLLDAGAMLCGPGANPTITDPFGELATADAAIVGALFPGTAETFARFPRLQLVCRTGIGYDRIDLAAATAAGVGIMNTPDAPTESTAEMAVALIFALARKIPRISREVRSGQWKNGPDQTGFDLAGRTLGLVGFGRIGRRVAEIVGGLRMQVLAFDPVVAADVLAARQVRRATSLETLFAESDVISLHAPLGAETRHMINASLLRQAKAGAVLINTSRGGVVDEAALISALQEGRLAGAALDVTDPEPPLPDNPLLTMENVIITPHVAGLTAEGRRRSQTAAVEQVLTALRGGPTVNLLNAWQRRPLDLR